MSKLSIDGMSDKRVSALLRFGTRFMIVAVAVIIGNMALDAILGPRWSPMFYGFLMACSDLLLAILVSAAYIVAFLVVMALPLLAGYGLGRLLDTRRRAQTTQASTKDGGSN